MKGKVKFFDIRKGWGFIKAEDDSEVFVHYSALDIKGFKTLCEGDIVNFELGIDNDGRKTAINVMPIITRSMVVHELSKEGLHIMRVINDKGKHGWYVVDKSNKQMVDKEMDLVQLAAYAGFYVEGLE